MSRGLIISPYLTTLMLTGLLLFSCSASATPSAEQPFGDWGTACFESPGSLVEDCRLEQQVLGEKGELVAKMAIWFPPQQNSPVALFTLPLGIYLPSGMGFKVDNGSVRHISIDRCTSQGCQAMINLDKDLLETVKQGDKATISFSATIDRKMSTTISLTGVTLGISSLTTK